MDVDHSHLPVDLGVPEAAGSADAAEERWPKRGARRFVRPVPASPVYNQPQAERAFQKLAELFSETFRCTDRRG